MEIRFSLLLLMAKEYFHVTFEFSEDEEMTEKIEMMDTRPPLKKKKMDIYKKRRQETDRLNRKENE